MVEEQHNGDESYMTVREMVTEIRQDAKDNEERPYLTVREMVTEIRQDIKEMRTELAPSAVTDDHETRIRALEGVRFVLQGIWVTSAVVVSGLVGAAGLAVAIFTAL